MGTSKKSEQSRIRERSVLPKAGRWEGFQRSVAGGRKIAKNLLVSRVVLKNLGVGVKQTQV